MGLKLLVIYFWLRNFIPLLLAGVIVAFFVWYPNKNLITEIGAVCFIVAGFLAGVYIAEKDRKENQSAFQSDADDDLENML